MDNNKQSLERVLAKLKNKASAHEPPIPAKEIAEKLNIPEARVLGYINGDTEVPDNILDALQSAYKHILKDSKVVRIESSRMESVSNGHRPKTDPATLKIFDNVIIQGNIVAEYSVQPALLSYQIKGETLVRDATDCPVLIYSVQLYRDGSYQDGSYRLGSISDKFTLYRRYSDGGAITYHGWLDLNIYFEDLGALIREFQAKVEGQ
jgi:hypothetical protein